AGRLPVEPLVIGSVHVPTSAVGYPVMAPAQQREIHYVGAAAVFEMVDMVGVAPGYGGVAAGEDAAPVSHAERPALIRGGQAGGATEVEGSAEAVDDHGVDVGVTEQGAGGAVLQPGAGRAGDLVGVAGVDDERDVRSGW